MPSRHALCVAVVAALLALPAHAEPLRYAGMLQAAGAPANGAHDLRLSLYDAAAGGHRIGTGITLHDVPVVGGSFSTEVDFGVPQETLERLWMQVEVAAADGIFEALPGRESLQAKALAGSACWNTDGNTGTTGADFLGTIENAPLNLRVSNQTALRILPTVAAPNLIGGLSANSVRSGVVGAVIGGGGEAGGFANQVSGNFGSIGGGSGNGVGNANGSPDASYGVVGGGEQNYVRAQHGAVSGGLANNTYGIGAVIPGGSFNMAGGRDSFAGGRSAQVRAPFAVGSVPASGNTVDGDRGNFIWNGGATPFMSTGERQFLVQAPGGAGFNVNDPAGTLHVRFAGSAATGADPDPSSVIVAERAGGNAFISIMGSTGTQRGLLFGEPASSADGAITYDNGGTNALQFRTNGNVTRMTLAANGDLTVTGNGFKPGGGAWAVSSDARLKRDIAPLGGALERLLQLRGVSFAYAKPDALRPKGTHTGFIAQEVQAVFPQWVETDADGYLMVSVQGFEALTVEALRELSEKNARLESDNELLLQRLELIEARLALAGQ